MSYYKEILYEYIFINISQMRLTFVKRQDGTFGWAHPALHPHNYTDCAMSSHLHVYTLNIYKQIDLENTNNTTLAWVETLSCTSTLDPGECVYVSVWVCTWKVWQVDELYTAAPPSAANAPPSFPLGKTAKHLQMALLKTYCYIRWPSMPTARTDNVWEWVCVSCNATLGFSCGFDSFIV